VLRPAGVHRSAQRVGLSLEDISAALATLPDQRTPTKADWARLSREWKAELEARIDSLQRLRDKLEGCRRLRLLSMRMCSLFNADDRMSDYGPVRPVCAPRSREVSTEWRRSAQCDHRCAIRMQLPAPPCRRVSSSRRLDT